ncbi:DUF3892 domain-containing protein [Nannocystis punicea]|uniref:DUF3892 domain-containing protein n=1 Tax=Nannocystis punicea TaxID=2995304 RepID=UPI0035316BA9
MSEYWIVGVDYREGVIAEVCAASLDRSTRDARGNWPMGEFRRVSRQQVMTWLRTGVQVYTATAKPNENSVWTLGARVEPTRDGKYITTEGNDTTRNNLGNLPRCTC